jgi:hypothetical protein
LDAKVPISISTPCASAELLEESPRRQDPQQSEETPEQWYTVLVNSRRCNFSTIFSVLLLLLWSDGIKDETPCLKENIPWCGIDTNSRRIRSLVYEDLVVG